MNLEHISAGRTPSESPEAAVVYVVDGDASVREVLEQLIRSAGLQPRAGRCPINSSGHEGRSLRLPDKAVDEQCAVVRDLARHRT